MTLKSGLSHIVPKLKINTVENKKKIKIIS